MDMHEALDFLKEHKRAILATTRADGRPQLSPVLAAVDDDGRILISTREPAMKTKNLRREPQASLAVISQQFFGKWAQIEGEAEIISLPAAMDVLVDTYRRLAGEHKDWDDYRAAMEREKRVVLRITPTRAGPTRQG